MHGATLLRADVNSTCLTRRGSYRCFKQEPFLDFLIFVISIFQNIHDSSSFPKADFAAWHTRWTLGSLLFLCSWGAMMGPMTYIRHLISTPRLPFTAAYFGSIALTLYFSLGLRSQILTLIFALIQIGCLVWYLVSYFPMGSSGLRMATSFGASRAAA
ncbi:hypothetical protein HYALB_00002837 [Hymenoscyphus albidus]|uniref:Protein transport protein SFT2 n=1 Tax=Hymenoscyphus albidus TaxID=595503 RepID=A0A9N9LIN5_9HELO|nr:hypothetical protein HYALB_00002837 [Hymenoscyphus albidus]